MNKIYKVIYSKVRNCYVVVSELAKNQRKCHSVNVKGKTALAAAILLALTSFCLPGMPSVAQAADGTESLKNNDYVGANGYYWYFDEKTNQWTKYPYKISSLNNNRSWQELPNYEGGGAKEPGAVTAGLYAQAGEQTVTIGNRNAGQSKGSVFIGELDGYNDGGKNDPVGMKNNYVTAVGFQSNATGWGSIAIGSNAVAENTRETSQVVDYDGNKGTSGTVQDDNYGIKLNPPITWSSVALGYNAKAKDGNIAIGANSEATSTDKGDSYVSVGNGTLKRRITNVAKGTDNSDVVTVGQMNDAIKQADNLNVNAGWGINVADEKDPKTGKGTKNVISLKHNLGTGYNDDEAKGMIIGGLVEDRDTTKQYGAADANSVIVGAGKALASGKSSVVVGGLDNVASGATSVVVGGDNNNAAGNQSSVFGGRDNKAAGVASTASGGIMNAAVGQQATAIGGSNNYVLGSNATAVGGLGRDYANGEVVYDSAVRGSSSVGIAGGSTGEKAIGALAAGHQAVVTTKNGTAIGYQATTDEAGTIAFGHDKGDASGYTIEWNKLPEGQVNADGTANDYTKAPKSVTPTTYKDAYYNRLVKVADGIDDHDVVVMEQLKQYAEKDASNLGNNIKVYKTDEKGNVQLGKDKQPVEDKDATTTAQKNSKDAWGKALGAEPFTTGTSAAATNASTSDQLVTGKTLYNYDAPVAETGKKLNYVSANNTTGQNLLNLDRQVKTNTDTLSDVNSRSVKYDTKTENGKTVVDNTKITLAGEGGTTITNLKGGVNDNDAATVGQLNSRIAGVTYTAGNGIAMDSTAKTISAKAGNGITVDTNGINAKAGTGITVNAKGINVNTGKHLSVNTSGKVDVDDNGEVAAEDGNLVTGKTVYDALHGGLDNITVGKDGKDGKDGSIGIAGQNGKDGYTMTYIKTEQGAAGVDGKDGITRVVYQDKDGNGKHTFATLDDGLKFKGDDSTVIARKLNEQLNITGGADSTKLTDKNIGVNSSTDGLKIQLAKDLTSITSISGSTDDKGAKITLDTTDKNISLNGGSIKDVASNLTKDGKIINGSDNNAASISDVQTLVQQGVDNGYTNGNGITIQKDGTSNVISVNKGDGLTFDNGKLAVNTGDGLTVDETTKALKIKTSDSNLKVDQNGIGLNNVITIGTAGTAGTNAHPITIDGTKGEVSGLNNTSWDSTADYSESTKAATESQVAAAVKDAIKQAGDNDIHVAAGSYAVNDQNQVSMNLVDKNNDTKGTVIITDVAKSSEMGDVSKLADGVKNAGGKTTTVVDAINNVNTSMNTKIGDQNYSTSNTSGSNKYVQDGDSITSAIGKLDGAVQQATTAAGQHSTVSAGSNITVTPAKQTDGHTDYQVALNKDITVNSVTANTATTDTLTVNNSATIGGVTIANKTISGLDDTKIEKGSTNAVNAGTIWNELRPSGGTYINQNNTTAQNITNLDTQVKRNSDLVNSDGSTIKIGGKDSATKVDISDKNGSGRVITGVVTDTNDASSAANVGYVNNMAAANTQQIYRDMNNAYGRLDNNINRAAAGSNALAALHPLEFDPDDKLSFAMGYGHYHNANAAAVGAFYQPDSKTQFNFGVALGNGDPGFNAGIAFKLGKSSPYAGMNRVTLIHAVQDLKASEEAKDKRIDALEKENQEMKKQLQAILAKLNG